MLVKSTASFQEKEPEENVPDKFSSKLATTRNVIKNKFSKAYANRLDYENNLLIGSSNDATSLSIANPLTTNDATSLSITNAITTTGDKNVPETSVINPNYLCDRLRFIISRVFAGDLQHEGEISVIIARLRELGIIV